MRNIQHKLEKLEGRIHVNGEPIFVEWAGNPWTEEEKAAMIKKHPDRKMFWKHLSKTIPYEDRLRGEQDGECATGSIGMEADTTREGRMEAPGEGTRPTTERMTKKARHGRA